VPCAVAVLTEAWPMAARELAALAIWFFPQIWLGLRA
jgi:hypothetical protein